MWKISMHDSSNKPWMQPDTLGALFTYQHQHQMDSIVQMSFQKCSIKFAFAVSDDNKSAMGYGMAWHWTGNKPLPELMMT